MIADFTLRLKLRLQKLGDAISTGMLMLVAGLFFGVITIKDSLAELLRSIDFTKIDG